MKQTMSHHANMTNIDADDKKSSSLYKKGIFVNDGSPMSDDDETSILDSFDDEDFEETINFEIFAPYSVDVAYGDDADKNISICNGNSAATFAKKRRVWVIRRRRFLYCFLGTILLSWTAVGLHSLIARTQRENANQLLLGGGSNDSEEYKHPSHDSASKKSHNAATTESQHAATTKSQHVSATKPSTKVIVGVESDHSEKNHNSSRDAAIISTANGGDVGEWLNHPSPIFRRVMQRLQNHIIHSFHTLGPPS